MTIAKTPRRQSARPESEHDWRNKPRHYRGPRLRRGDIVALDVGDERNVIRIKEGVDGQRVINDPGRPSNESVRLNASHRYIVLKGRVPHRKTMIQKIASPDDSSRTVLIVERDLLTKDENNWLPMWAMGDVAYRDRAVKEAHLKAERSRSALSRPRFTYIDEDAVVDTRGYPNGSKANTSESEDSNIQTSTRSLPTSTVASRSEIISGITDSKSDLDVTVGILKIATEIVALATLHDLPIEHIIKQAKSTIQTCKGGR